MMFFMLCLVVIILQFITPSLSQPVITRVSGCVDAGSQTYDCVTRMRLTIHGHGFLTGLEGDPQAQEKLDFMFDVPPVRGNPVDCLTSAFVNPPMNFSDTLVVCLVGEPGFMTVPTDQWLSIYSVNSETGEQSTPFAGVRLKTRPIPVIRGVAGCPTQSVEPISASNCPVDTPITLIGENFISLAGSMIFMHLGSVSFRRYVDKLTDTQLVLTSLTYDLTTLIAIDSFDTSPISFKLSDAYNTNWETNTITLQFAHIPDPVITSIEPTRPSGGCDDPATGNLINCVQGRARFTISGRYFFGNIDVTIGGQKAYKNVRCVSRVWPALSFCTIEIPIYEYAADQLHEVVLTSFAGTTTASGKIGFAGLPVLAFTRPCVVTSDRFSLIGLNADLSCLAGETFDIQALYVANFDQARFSVYHFDSSTNSTIDMPLDCSAIGSNKQFRCVAPALSYGLTKDDFTTIRLTSAENMAESVPTKPWTADGAPRLHSISGCHSTSGDRQFMNECLNEDVITLIGERFTNGSALLGDFNLYNLLEVSSDGTRATFQIPLELESIAYDSQVSISIANQVTYASSNIMYITVVTQLTQPSSSQGSGLSSAAIALATVFSIVGACLLVGLIVWLMRTRKPGALHSGEMTDSSSQLPLSDL